MKKLAGIAMLCLSAAVHGQVINELYKLTAADAAEADFFGYSIAVSGNLAIVGSWLDDDIGGGAGAAYLFDTSTGEQIHKLVAQDGQTTDNFGYSVAISGTTAIVGARHHNGITGAAYIYDTTSGQQLFKLSPPTSLDIIFGSSAAISGTTAIVGAWRDAHSGGRPGAAYVFDTTTGQQLFRLISSDAAPDDSFGWSVAISGTTAVIGAVRDDDAGTSSGSAYVFDTTTGQQLFKLTATDAAPADRFGQSVAISGSIAIVGACNDDDSGFDSGSAYLFDLTTGEQLLKLVADDAQSGDSFGWSVAIDDNTAIVGADPDSPVSLFGYASKYGSAYIFDTTTGEQLYKLSASDAAAGDAFGFSVGISDGTAVVSAWRDDDAGNASGSAYMFDLLDIDSDGDGLLDEWERNGIPYTDFDGVERRYILDSNGDGMSDANWLKKDIFVEVDAMAGRAPSMETLQRVVDAFDPPGKILVPAVAGLRGGLPNITLHIQSDGDRGLTLTNSGNYVNGINGFNDFATDKALYFGTFEESIHPDANALLEAKRKAYRYCIFANTYGGTTSSGVAEGIPGDDFMVTLGLFTPPGGTPDEQAGTFMHELGHTLGLKHGGGDGIHFKPNYYSIMNYWWQMPNAWQGSAWGLRYSEHKLPTLNESALSEINGIGADYPGVGVRYRVSSTTTCTGVFCDPNACFLLASLEANAPVDWDGDCAISTTGTVSADINDMSFLAGPGAPSVITAVFGAGLTSLDGHNDWLNLHYDVQTTPTYAPGSSPQETFCDYNQAVAEFMASLPPPPTACIGDIADDFGTIGADGLVSFGDFLALLSLVGPCPGNTPGCVGDIADDFETLDGDGKVSLGDFLALLGVIGPCP